MEEAPTTEVVKALLDYLVDPLLPLAVSSKVPLIETQEAVAKQMHAVVLLYNYYHRLQNPQLEYMDFEAFCKLTVTLKPTLIVHMKCSQQSDFTGSGDKENHLSITEKAMKDACKVSLALTSLKDVSLVERWPVSKVSVLLVDPKKEKCMLSFDTITNGVWSVIEKCLNFVDLSSEFPITGKHTNKRKQKTGKEMNGEPTNRELAYQQIAISAVKEATGLKQSEITVLEKHITYSLSEDNMAAYFYIVQSTQSSNEDNQLPIKTVLQSMQGPLLEWTSHDWTLTQKIEYYNVLPYAQIMSDWVSRECLSVCSQTPNLSRFGGAEKDSETKPVEIEKSNCICLHNLIVKLDNTNINNGSQGPENSNEGEALYNMKSTHGNLIGTNCRSKEPSVAYISNRKKKVDGKEKSDKEHPEKPSDLEPNEAVTSKRKEVGDEEKHDNCSTKKASDKEIKNNRESVFGNCTGANSYCKESSGADSSCNLDKKSLEKPSDVLRAGADTSNRKGVDDRETSDKCIPQKPSDMEIQVSNGGMCVNFCSTNTHVEESIGEEKSCMEGDVDENPDKHLSKFSNDGEVTGVDIHNRNEDSDSKGKPDSNASEKHSDRGIQDSMHGDCTDVESCGKVPIEEESSKKEEGDSEEKPGKCAPEMPSDVEPTTVERFHSNSKDVDDREKPDESTPEKPCNAQSKDNMGNIYERSMDPNSCSEDLTGADSFYRKGEFDVKEKHDECHDIRNSNSISFRNADTGALKMISAEEPGTIRHFSSKRQKTSVYGISVPCMSRGGENRNVSRVYHHQQRKLSVQNGPGSSAAVTQCNMVTSEAMKWFGNESVGGKVAGTCIQGYLSSNLNDMPAESTTLVPFELSANDAGKLQTLLATKEPEISETALRVLLQKREEMCYQQRMLEDKIASCSSDIQKIIDGDKEALSLKLEAMINFCNDTYLKGKNQVEGVINQSNVGETSKCSRRSRQSDSILNVQSSCQELDGLCRENNWRLPVYSISALKGGFIAKIAMKEIDFDLSCESELLSTPHAARDSAASLMLLKFGLT